MRECRQWMERGAFHGWIMTYRSTSLRCTVLFPPKHEGMFDITLGSAAQSTNRVFSWPVFQ